MEGIIDPAPLLFSISIVVSFSEATQLFALLPLRLNNLSCQGPRVLLGLEPTLAAELMRLHNILRIVRLD